MPGNDIEKELWKSIIVIKLTLLNSGVPEDPPSIYYTLPSHGYLHFATDTALQLFHSSLISQRKYVPYFEFEGIILPWHVPVGVLYDLLGQNKKPWNLNIVFPLNLPPILSPWDEEESFKITPIKNNFLTSLKESAYVCRGSEGSNQINTTYLETRDELWKSIENQDYEKYDNIFQNLNLNPIAKDENDIQIPVRIFIYEKKDGNKNWNENVISLSRPITITKDGEHPTLRETIKENFPNFSIISDYDKLDDNQHNLNNDDKLEKDVVVKICSIEMPLDVPLAGLHAKLHAPDYFLYIAISVLNNC